MFTTTSRKVLVPFATLVAAGAVAIGSGATFTSTTQSTISATSGTLVHANSDAGATLTITDLKPGASETGTLTIRNVGSLDSTLKVIASAPGSPAGLGELAPALQLKIEGENGIVFDDDFEKVDDNTAGYSLGDLFAGQTPEDSITVTVTVRMEDNSFEADGFTGADNDYQGKAAGLTLTFVTTQTSGDESGQSGWDNP